jgi:hypothetical protein
LAPRQHLSNWKILFINANPVLGTTVANDKGRQKIQAKASPRPKKQA